MINILYKVIYWYLLALLALVKWQTFSFVLARWPDYKKQLRFKKQALIALIISLIIAVYYIISFTQKGDL